MLDVLNLWTDTGAEWLAERWRQEDKSRSYLPTSIFLPIIFRHDFPSFGKARLHPPMPKG